MDCYYKPRENDVPLKTSSKEEYGTYLDEHSSRLIYSQENPNKTQYCIFESSGGKIILYLEDEKK